MTVLVYETDIGTQLNKKGKFSNLKFKAGEIPLSISLDDVSNLKGENALLVQQVQDKCWPLINKELPKLVSSLQTIDEGSDEKKRDKDADKAIADFCAEIYDDIVKMASGVFHSFAKDKKDYTKYKVKSGLKIAVSGISLAGSIALTGASGWSGVGTVVGAVGMVRSTASLVQQVVNLSKETEDIYDRIVANVLKMRKQLAGPNIKENTAQQVAATVMNKVFAVEIESLLVTVEGIEKDFELLLNKVRGNKANAVSLANDIPKIMKKQDEVVADIEDLEIIVTKTGKQESQLAKLKTLQKKQEKELDALLKEITRLSDLINSMEKWTVLYHKEIESISKKYSGKAVKVAGLATDLVIAAASFAGANFNDPASTIKDLNTAGKNLITAISLTQDGLNTINDSGSAIYAFIKKG